MSEPATNTAATQCECAGPGFCPRYQREMTEFHVAVCRGEASTPDKCAVYRANWSRLAKAGCEHRGDELRREECPKCCGKVRLIVFGCAVHGECTIAKPLSGVACCGGCGDYAAPVGPGG